MGIFFGLAAAFCFSSMSIMTRVGQRTRPDDDGVFMSVFVNTLMLGAATALVTWPEWDGPAMVSFVVGGVIGTVGGRTSMLRAVRLIGPSRSNAFLTGAPVVAAIGGWLFLSERMGWLEVLGGAMVIGGLLLLIRARSRGVDAAQTAVPLLHYVIAMGAPLSFGTAFVFRKWGIERFPSAVVGAFMGIAASFLVILAIEAARRNLSSRVRSNFTNPSWWFVGGGVATSLALFSQYQAFTYLEAWVVGIFQATQAIWTLLLSIIFLRGDERIDTPLVASIGMVVAGVVLISVQV